MKKTHLHSITKPVIIALLLIGYNSYSQSFLSSLKVEHLYEPIGIDNPLPRLSWQMNDAGEGTLQVAYQLIVGIDSTEVAAGNGAVWNSGKVESDSQLANCNATGILSFTKYYWKVIVWNHKNQQINSAISNFETAFIGNAKWKGSWISDNNDIDFKPAPYFRKTFSIAKKIKSARAYIAVAGLYELFINGKRIGTEQLNPNYTRFDRRTLYITHDVTDQLHDGVNALGVLLGNGWYNHQSTAVWFFDKAPWRNRPAFCMDLRITYVDGTTEVIGSGNEWRTSDGGLRFNSIYTAEHYDARLEQTGWNTMSFDDSKWKPATLRSAPSQNIVAQVMHPIRNAEAMQPQQFKKINDTTYLYDLGRNISGVTQLNVSGSEGTVIKLKHGERVTKAGRVDLSNIDVHYRPKDNSDPFQTDIFILSGKGIESFKPRFNYKGFQFIEVTSSKPIELTQQSLTGYFMHSDVPSVGSITSSNEMINKLWAATNNSYLSNLFGYPTDCPQREKNGWTGDAHIAVETGLYSFDGITIYEKWLADHRDEQQPNGVLPAIIPTSGWGYQWANGPDWTSTIAIIPWEIYLFYGDSKILNDNYENIKSYVDHITELYPDGLTTWGLGDWVPVKSKSPVELTSSIYYYVDAAILAKASLLLAKNEDFKKYSSLANKIKDAINSKYLDKEHGTYGTGVQTELSAPLYWGIVPEDLKSKVADNLATRVASDNFHLDTGVLGGKAILNALSENGYADIAYKIATQETYPSWGWWIKNGATTLYENWNINAKNDISLNHIMFGEIGAWLYKGIGGIYPDEKNPGFKNILLKPYFPKDLNSFEATYNSLHGKIISKWTMRKNTIYYSVTIPSNSMATFNVPKGFTLKNGMKSLPLTSGTHELRLTADQ